MSLIIRYVWLGWFNVVEPISGYATKFQFCCMLDLSNVSYLLKSTNYLFVMIMTGLFLRWHLSQASFGILLYLIVSSLLLSAEFVVFLLLIFVIKVEIAAKLVLPIVANGTVVRATYVALWIVCPC